MCFELGLLFFAWGGRLDWARVLGGRSAVILGVTADLGRGRGWFWLGWLAMRRGVLLLARSG